MTNISSRPTKQARYDWTQRISYQISCVSAGVTKFVQTSSGLLEESALPTASITQGNYTSLPKVSYPCHNY